MKKFIITYRLDGSVLIDNIEAESREQAFIKWEETNWRGKKLEHIEEGEVVYKVSGMNGSGSRINPNDLGH